MSKRLAICLGTTRVDPAAYDGWPGTCPGCDRDAARFATLCHDAGFNGVQVLVNEAAQPRFLKPAFVEASKLLTTGDLLVLYYSGHGGQQWDTSGDEQDAMDETLCLYSGELVDDDIARFLCKLRRGVRVLFVTDTCNSGTNFRGRGRVKRSTPVVVRKAPQQFKGSLLHFGGCEDGRSSYGAEDGGVFTNALLDVMWCHSRRPLTYADWFDRAAGRMPEYQTPVFSFWGETGFKVEALT